MEKQSTRSAGDGQIQKKSRLRRLDRQRLERRRIKQMALPPCHALLPVLCGRRKNVLPALSAVPIFFWVYPSILHPMHCLPMMIAHVMGLEPGEFVHTLGDAHLYSESFRTGGSSSLSREPRALTEDEFIKPCKVNRFSTLG